MAAHGLAVVEDRQVFDANANEDVALGGGRGARESTWMRS